MSVVSKIKHKVFLKKGRLNEFLKVFNDYLDFSEPLERLSAIRDTREVRPKHYESAISAQEPLLILCILGDIITLINYFAVFVKIKQI